MDSNDLKKRGFGVWQPFGLTSEHTLLRELPTSFGVYSMRLSNSEPMTQGSSDIAYIGRATNQNGVLGRIRQYFHPGWRQSTNLKMKARLVDGIKLEIAFVTTADAESAIHLESELLLLFEAEHTQKPPYNKQAALAHLWKTPSL
jgi:excinuclease UvrABC nuclease subunit